MKKIFYFLIIFLFLIIKADSKVSADNFMAESSATLIQYKDFNDYKINILREYFVKNKSPLAEYAEDFILSADKYNLDWRLIPAITGVESTYGKFIPENSYNAYGWANGNYYFNSWQESIDIVASTLRNKYLDRGYISINQIARIYAPPSTTWASKVKYIMNKIDPLPLEYSL